MAPAPIVLFCYNRPTHLRRTVEGLQANTLAPQSELYIFSDGPKSEADAERVGQVRAYLKTITGFAAVHVDESPQNRGLGPSVIRGVSQVVERHGRVIVMEDDLLSTPDLLNYLNEALDFYERNPLVFSISSYMYPIALPANYPHDVLLLPRASSLGWATWKDRWAKADWDMRDYPDFIRDPEARRQFTRGGADLLPMLQKQQRGLISSWAVRWSYTHYKQDRYCLFPRHSKVQHIGYDEGTNVTLKHRHHVDLHEGPVRLTADVQPDAEVIRRLQRYARPTMLRQLINRIKFGYR